MTKPKLIEKAFMNFMYAVTNNGQDEIGPVQKYEMMKCFYGGASSMFGIMNNIVNSTDDKDKSTDGIGACFLEIKEFSEGQRKMAKDLGLTTVRLETREGL